MLEADAVPSLANEELSLDPALADEIHRRLGRAFSPTAEGETQSDIYVYVYIADELHRRLGSAFSPTAEGETQSDTHTYVYIYIYLYIYI